MSAAIIKKDMSENQAGVEREAGETKPAVRLRQAERRQMLLAVQCADDLILQGREHVKKSILSRVPDGTFPVLFSAWWMKSD